jgi:hypothetical protein
LFTGVEFQPIDSSIPPLTQLENVLQNLNTKTCRHGGNIQLTNQPSPLSLHHTNQGFFFIFAVKLSWPHRIL